MRKAVGFDSYYSGQAQHLIQRKAELTGKITHIPIKPKKTLWQKLRSFLGRPTVQIILFLAIFCSAIGAVGKGGF